MLAAHQTEGVLLLTHICSFYCAKMNLTLAGDSLQVVGKDNGVCDVNSAVFPQLMPPENTPDLFI